MSITGGYTLDLYCDNLNIEPGDISDGVHSFGYRIEDHSQAQYVGERGESCRNQARRAGWKLKVSTGSAICPVCNGKVKQEFRNNG